MDGVSSPKPLSPRALRSRAIVFPCGVVLIVWALNVAALASHIGPQQPGIWMFLFVVATAALARYLWQKAREGDVSPSRTLFTALVATIVWFVLSGALPKVGREPEIKIGDRGTRPGGGFNRSVSNQFKRPQLELLYARAQRFGPGGELDEFTCGDAIQDFRFEMTLEPAEEYRERLVNVAYTPDLDAGGADRCESFGLSYLFNVALAEIDLGPPVDYGYVDPHTGQQLGPIATSPPRKPICRCDLRHLGREWVAWSEERANELN
jgi:hypothetical protein